MPLGSPRIENRRSQSETLAISYSLQMEHADMTADKYLFLNL